MNTVEDKSPYHSQEPPVVQFFDMLNKVVYKTASIELNFRKKIFNNL